MCFLMCFLNWHECRCLITRSIRWTQASPLIWMCVVLITRNSRAGYLAIEKCLKFSCSSFTTIPGSYLFSFFLPVVCLLTFWNYFYKVSIFKKYFIQLENNSSHIFPTPDPTSSYNHQSVLYICELIVFCCCCCCSLTFHIWGRSDGVCLSLSDLFNFQHNALEIPPYFHKWQNFILFYVWVIFHC